MSSSESSNNMSFGDGIGPVNLAFIRVCSAPVEESSDPAKSESTTAASANYQESVLDERTAQILTTVHAKDLAQFQGLLSDMRSNMAGNVIDEGEIDHFLNIFSLGLLVGIKTGDITEEYAQQGLKELDSPE